MTEESIVEWSIIGLNVAAGAGCAIPLAKALRRWERSPRRLLGFMAVLIGVYFVESAAVVTGMLTQVFTVGLAFVWGVLFGLRYRSRLSRREVVRGAVLLALYTCLPTASFLLVPVLLGIGGDPLFTSGGGARLGIPQFLPWPVNTIAGFFLTLVIGTAVAKTSITVSMVNFLVGRGDPRATAG